MAKTKIEIIEDTKLIKGLKDTRTVDQKILFKIGSDRFKITIHVESYDFQSYATLKKWAENNGFATLISKYPSQFKITTNTDFSNPDAFKPIIEDLTRIAIDFVV